MSNYVPRNRASWQSDKERPAGISPHEWKSCKRKAVFETRELAEVKGQFTYRCRYCGKWHRSSTDGSISADLLSIARRNARAMQGTRR